MKMKIIVWFIVLIAVAVAGFAVYVWIALHWSYSSGERAGYVQKFSRKGWVCKTWEGELTMMPVAGSIPEKFMLRAGQPGSREHQRCYGEKGEDLL